MDTKTNRLTYIDIAKGIGISMIVWGHAHCFASIYCVTAVPLFFLISGFLYDSERSFHEHFKRKLLTLYLPFVLCNLIWPTFVLFHNMQMGYPIKSNIIYIVLILLALRKDGFLFGATWFLNSLFYTSVIYKFLDILMKKVKYKNYFIMAFYLIITFVASQLMPFLDTEFRRALILPIFFAVGVIVKSNINWIKKIDNKITIITVSFVFILLNYYLTTKGLVSYSYKSNLAYNLFTFVINSLLASYIVIYISKLISKHIDSKACKLLSYIGENSLHILIWQFVFFELLTAQFFKVNNIPLYMIDRCPHVFTNHGIWGFMYFLIGMGGPILLVNLFRFCLRLFNKSKVTLNKAI